MSESPLMSMTGFGSASSATDSWTISVRARSVNHRNLDLQLRLPEPARDLEAGLRDRVRTLFHRGRIEISVEVVGGGSSGDRVRVDEGLARRLIAAARQLGELEEGLRKTSAGEILALPGVVTAIDDSEAWSVAEDELVLDLVSKALAELIEARRREGASLLEVLDASVGGLERTVDAIRGLQEGIRSSIHDGLQKRLQALLDEIPVDPIRLAQESALLADRSDVCEELDRLVAHLTRTREILAGPSPRGKKLDFLMQEIQREFNTLSAKNRDTEAARSILDGRTLCEQMREQVQNVE